MKFDCIVANWRAAFLRLPRTVGIALAAGGAAVVLSLLPANVVVASDPADDNFESGGLAGGTGWLDGWQTSGSVDVVNYGSSITDSRHLRLRAGDGIAYRDVDLAGSEGLELTGGLRADPFDSGEFAAL